MRQSEAQELAGRLMVELDCPPSFVFKWHNRRAAAGTTTFKEYGRGEVDAVWLSRCFVDCNTREAVEDTIRHEIAHAKCGPWVDAHGTTWKRMAVACGAVPKSHCVNAVRPPGKYHVVCTKCGHEGSRDRLPVVRQELDCWNQRRTHKCGGRLQWVDRKTGEVLA